MADDESLSKGISELTKAKRGFTHKEMFGGIVYLLNGDMFVGVHKNGLIIRYNPQNDDEVTTNKHVRLYAITGCRKKGWPLVGFGGVKENRWNKCPSAGRPVFELPCNFEKLSPSKNSYGP